MPQWLDGTCEEEGQGNVSQLAAQGPPSRSMTERVVKAGGLGAAAAWEAWNMART